MPNFEPYNPPDDLEHKSISDGYTFTKKTKVVDGRVWELVDADEILPPNPPSVPQTQSFVLDENGQAVLSVTGFAGILSDNSLYEIYFEGQRKFYTNGDFLFSGSTITSTNGADDEGLKCFIKIY